MKFFRLIAGIALSLGGGTQVPSDPLLGLAVAMLGGAMVLDAVVAEK